MAHTTSLSRWQRGTHLWTSLMLALGLALLLSVSAMAQEEATEQESISHVDDAELERLFPKLANATSQEEARVYADQIWQVWLNPTTPEVAEQMDVIAAARSLRSFERAIELLTHVIETFPGYAEAWNQRATLYFFLGDYESSLADVEEVLKREPRHFGALSGQSVIYLRLGEEFLARQAILEALKYHPFLQERALFPELFDPPTQI